LSSGRQDGEAHPQAPSISAIIPNYNHARFLKERIRSILEQTIKVDEIIILDDASTDHSREIIEDATRNSPVPIKTCFNTINSRNIFSQWKKGLELASGDLVWICESDDSCDVDFLQFLRPYFTEPSIMLTFGRIDFIDQTGALRRDVNYNIGLGSFFGRARIASAASWFNGPFGLRCVIRNVGGCIFRRQTIDEKLMAELRTYEICGDWLLYSRLARGGQIAYEPRARSYFRLHGTNSSVASFETISFYEEHVRIAYALRRNYGAKIRTLRNMLRKVWHQCKSRLGKQQALEFANRISLRAIAAQPRVVQHILIALDEDDRENGGAFPFLFANELSRQGHDVSMLVTGSKTALLEFQSLLKKEIPIFTKAHIERNGLDNFITEFGITLINTHHARADEYLYQLSPRIDIPYIATDHQSHRTWSVDEQFANWLYRNVDKWISSTGDNGVPIAITSKITRGSRRFISGRFKRSKSIDQRDADLLDYYITLQGTFFSSPSL
jgi:glycosyltransferase involved in cell wall biosynthesis